MPLSHFKAVFFHCTRGWYCRAALPKLPPSLRNTPAPLMPSIQNLTAHLTGGLTFWESCPNWEFEQFGSGCGDYKTENPPESIAQILPAPGTAGQKSKFCVPIHANLMRAQALPSQKWAQTSSDVTEASSRIFLLYFTGQPWCSLEL